MGLIRRIKDIPWILLISILATPSESQRPAPPLESVRLHGYSAPIPGRWLTPEDNRSGIPLGGIGAGFVELRADGLIHDAAIRNDWLKPGSPPALSLVIRSGGRSTVLVGAATHPSSQGS